MPISMFLCKIAYTQLAQWLILDIYGYRDPEITTPKLVQYTEMNLMQVEVKILHDRNLVPAKQKNKSAYGDGLRDDRRNCVLHVH